MSSTARAVAPLVLFAMIVTSLVAAIISGFVQLLWLGQPLGASSAIVAFVSLYIFGLASLVLLIFYLSEQKKLGI